MEILNEVLCWVIGLLIVLTVFVVVRDFLIYRERRRILDKAKWAAQSGNPEEAQRLLDLHESVSWNTMMLKFWKPVKSFYEEPQ
jgi:beta-lactamase regulating signal transducer with metallopeptidase domain